MSRLESFRRHLWCKLLMLLLWTVFLCCVLYVSRESRTSIESLGPYRKTSSPSTMKRSDENRISVQGRRHCGESPPTPKDLNILKRLFDARKQHREKRVMHCSVVILCDDQGLEADCYSSECNTFQLQLTEGNGVIPLMSREKVSQVIGTALRENNYMTVEDLNRYLDVHCHGSTEAKLHLTGDMFSGGKCNGHVQRPDERDAIQHLRAASQTNIHVLYFRFLSVWEFPFRFPGLASMLGKAENENSIKVLNFDKHQATKWSDADLLSTLLGGKTGQFNFNKSVLGMVEEYGYCFRLHDFSCSRSQKQEILLRNITSAAQAITCPGNPLRHRESIMERLCTPGNFTETKMRTVLTSLLYNAHDAQRGEKKAKSGPVFSVSILNIRDFAHPELVDSVLRNYFLKAMSGEDSVTVMVSGAGNPQFLSLDHPGRLQRQASNPVLMLASSGGFSAMTPEEVQRFNKSLFSMRNVHFLVKHLVRKHSHQSLVQRQADDVVPAEEGPETCRRLGVSPPFKCLCSNEFVSYENDTMMVGFAELAVSLINRRLESLPPTFGGGGKQNTASPCGQLTGLSFRDVRVGRYNDRTRILMGLHMSETVSRDRIFRNVVLDVWDTDRMPKSDLFLSKADKVGPQLRVFPMDSQSLKTLCRSGENLDFPMASDRDLLVRWSNERHFGRKGTVRPVHDDCLYLIARDFGDSVSLQAANVCRDRKYDVVLHLSLVNMISLTALPLSVSLGHAQKEMMTALVKVSYSVTMFDYRMSADFVVSYDK